MYQSGSPISRAIFYRFHGQIDDGENTDPSRDNEVRRLVDLQLPNWIAIAPTDGRFSRDCLLVVRLAKICQAMSMSCGDTEMEAAEVHTCGFFISPDASIHRQPRG
jgi:hypothetical protein